MLTTNTELLRDLADPSNRAVWEEFDARYRPVLEGFARRLGLSDGDAEEVAQASLARFVEEFRAGRYERGRGRLRGWLFSIARARALDLRREQARRREVRGESALGALPDDETMSALFDEQWRAALLRQAFEALRERTRTDPKTVRVLELMLHEQKKAPEVAAALSMPVEQVHLAKHRALKRLRELVAELEQEA